MEYNTDGTYKNYGFRDGSPFNPMPYKMNGYGATYEESSQEAVRILGDKYGLGVDQAGNWLDTGNPEVGWIIDAPYSWYCSHDADFYDDDAEAQVRFAAEIRLLSDGSDMAFDSFRGEVD